MELRNISSQDSWNRFVQEREYVPFLQSFEWGAFQEQQGHRVERLSIWNREKFCLGASIIHHRLPLQYNFLYCPHGPLFANGLSLEERRAAFAFLFQYLQRVYKTSIFLRCDPHIKLPSRFDTSRVSHWVQPEYTQRLSLEHASQEAQLLANMKQKTRYNIRLAFKKGVRVARGVRPADFPLASRMIRDTLQRRDLRAHPLSYYQNMLEYGRISETFGIVRLYQAALRGQVLAVGIFIFYGDTVTYLHGGSSQSLKSVMAPYALHWQVICDAQIEGFRYFDFGGVAPPSQTQHKLTHVTRFKTGFGGAQVRASYLYEFPLRKNVFRAFALAKKFRHFL